MWPPAAAPARPHQGNHHPQNRLHTSLPCEHNNGHPQVTHTVSWTLPAVPDTAQLFAVRGVFRFGLATDNVNTPCTTGSYDEADDLVFQVLPNTFGV